MFVESAGRPNQYGMGGVLYGALNPGEGRWADPNGEYKVKGSNPNTVANATAFLGSVTVPPGKHDKKAIGQPAGTVAIQANAAIDGNTCSMNCNNINEPYSFHGTGINVAFADGSVHFFTNSTPVWLLGQLATKGGGEPLQQNLIP
jgi:prepilin-type processing-associated H-X9-DG protein